MERIRVLIYKEWLETTRNRLVFWTTLMLPVIFVIIPLATLVATSAMPASQLSNNSSGTPPGFVNNPAFAGFSTQETIQAALISQFMLFFLLIPIAVPITIATYSIVGEKAQRSLEPLLATPISIHELLLSKGIAAALPAVLAGWLSFIVFALLARLIVVSDRVYGVILSPTWIFAMLVLSPLLTLLAVNISVMVSARVNDPRAAQQIGSLLVFPFLGFFFATLAGIAVANIPTFIVVSFVVLVIDGITLFLAVQLFQRETILTRWK